MQAPDHQPWTVRMMRVRCDIIVCFIASGSHKPRVSLVCSLDVTFGCQLRSNHAGASAPASPALVSKLSSWQARVCNRQTEVPCGALCVRTHGVARNAGTQHTISEPVTGQLQHDSTAILVVQHVYVMCS